MTNDRSDGSERTVPEDASYEELVRQLESSVVRLETGELSLEESVLEYEFGMNMIERCNAVLDRAELRVTELSVRAQASAAELPREE